jgi:hypothetical protein
MRYALILWLAPASLYLVVRRKTISGIDAAMVAVALFVLATFVMRDTVLASGR